MKELMLKLVYIYQSYHKNKMARVLQATENAGVEVWDRSCRGGKCRVPPLQDRADISIRVFSATVFQCPLFMTHNVYSIFHYISRHTWSPSSECLEGKLRREKLSRCNSDATIKARNVVIELRGDATQ